MLGFSFLSSASDWEGGVRQSQRYFLRPVSSLLLCLSFQPQLFQDLMEVLPALVSERVLYSDLSCGTQYGVIAHHFACR